MSLINRGAKASKWAALSMIVLTIVQFVQLIILSRLLQPSDFGLMGMTMVIISFSQAFVDMGVSNALISHKEISSNQRQSLYWFNIFTGFFIFIIIFSSATLISSFYNEPQLIQLIRLMSLIFLIIPIGQQIQILLQKELNFKLISYIEITSAMLGFLMSFMTAYNGFGVFSLAVGQIVNFFIKSLLLLLVGMRKWPIQLHFSLSEIRRYINFGLFQIGERSVHFLSYNLDYIIIGRFLGAEALGFYTFAYQLIVLPILKINPVITQVAFPLLAKVQYDTIRLKIGYLKVIKYLSYINYPIYFGLFITGPMIVPLLFGEKWSDSIVLIQILCAMGLLRSSISPVNTLLLSKGRADLGFKWSLISMALLIPAISLGAYLNGVVGICISYVILQFILLLLNYFLLIKKILGQCLIQYAFSMLPAFLFSSVMLITLWIILNYMKLGIMWLELSIQIIIGIIVYLSQIYLFKYHVFKEMLHLIISKQKIDKDEGATI